MQQPSNFPTAPQTHPASFLSRDKSLGSLFGFDTIDQVPTLTQYILVAAAGSVGAVLRLFVAAFSNRFFGTAFPYGTFLINITGSFILGWFMALCAKPGQISDTTRLAIAVGFVGSYTTFSTLMYESNALLTENFPLRALLNLIGSLILGLLAVRLGLLLGHRY